MIKNKLLLDIIACPICYKKLSMNSKTITELICKNDNIVFCIKQGIPVLLLDKTKIITL